MSSPALAATRGATVSSVNLRAGPGTWYPVVMTMPPSAALTIYGCLDAASWCDVSWGGARGWVSSNYVSVYYQGQTVALSPALIPMIGLTVVAFNQAYWNTHYAAQPWYGSWSTYYRTGPAYGGAARGGCVGAACGGSAVVRGPNGGGAAVRGVCGPERCAGGAVVRQPGGGLEFHRGVMQR
nr:SH3 domain-containing protein [Camelimonas lactis]